MNIKLLFGKKVCIAIGFMFGLIPCLNAQIFDQELNNQSGVINHDNIAYYTIPLNATTHFVSGEKIEFVDISSYNIEADIPENNNTIFRLRPTPDAYNGDMAIVTVLTQTRIYTFKVILAYVHDNIIDHAASEKYYNKTNNLITLNPEDAVVLNSSKLSDIDFKRLVAMIITKKPTIRNVVSKEHGTVYKLNNIYTLGNYVFLDITLTNKSNIQYNINDVRFRLEDKKLYKATVSQEIEFKPIYALYPIEQIIVKGRKSFRNIYVFDKFTYPNQKTFIAEVTETEHSGRKNQIRIDYAQLLDADFLNE